MPLHPPYSEIMSNPTESPARRPLGRRFVHLVRRAHLYVGLFFLPWAVL
jgi:hypothetical protein